MLILCALPGHPQVSFVAPIALEDISPFQVVQGDFHGNGRLELVTIDANSVNLAGKSIATSPSGSFFYAAIVADFNGDGKLDIAVLEYPGALSSGFFLLLGNGNGIFQTTPTVVITNNAKIFLAGDFNRDGKLDVAAIGSSVDIFPGDGAGGFGPAASTALPQTPYTAAAADFTGDHKLDLAFGTNLINSNSIFIYKGNGDGTFTPGDTFSVPGPASGFAAADLNHDGKVDLIVGIGNNTSVAGTVNILFGNGDGTFLSPVSYPIPRSYSTIVLTDLNHDGQIDLVLGCGGTGQFGGAVFVLFNKGDGTFEPAITSELGITVSSMVAGDYNADGVTDIAFVQNGGVGATTEVALGTGGGHFEQTEDYVTANGPTQVFTGDFLGTGAADIVTIGNDSGVLFPSAGNGTFGKPKSILVQSISATLGIEGDFNGDGLPDLIIAGSENPFGGAPSGFEVFFGQEGTTLRAGPTYTNLNLDFTSLAQGDLNQDGVADLVLICSLPRLSYVVAMGTGGGHFTIGPPVSAGVAGTTAAIGDFNHDGKPDLILAGQGVYLLLGNGDGTFGSAATIAPPANDVVHAVGAVDVNGDGNLDVVWTVSSTLSASPGSAVCVRLGLGDGTFQKRTCYAVGGGPNGLAFADFNSDGKLDIATSNESGDAVSLLLGSGAGTFEPAGSFGVGGGPAGIATADFNRDAKPDLVVPNSTSSSISVLLNNTNP